MTDRFVVGETISESDYHETEILCTNPRGLLSIAPGTTRERSINKAALIVSALRFVDAMPVGGLAGFVEALAGCIELIEGWAYGPLFEKAGIRWSDDVCQAPALVQAKKLLGLDPNKRADVAARLRTQ